jgi:hypothetical protein
MNKILLAAPVLFLLTACDLPNISPGSCSEDSFEEYSVKGDFLLDHGERIAFAPKCYYDPASPDFKCGLALIGAETSKTIVRTNDNMDCPGTSSGAQFNYDSTDFSKLVVTTSDGSSKPLLSYSYTKNAFNAYYTNNYYDNREGYDYFASINSLNKVDEQQVQINLIESDSQGIVDFSIKDAKGNKVHLKYDLSYFINKLQNALIIDDDTLRISYGHHYEYLLEDPRSDNKCFYRSIAVSTSLHYDTNTIANSLMEKCLSECSDCHGEIPVAKMHYTTLELKSPSLILTCESEPEIQDTVPLALSYFNSKKDYCKSIRVLLYIDHVYPAGCKPGDINNCPAGIYNEIPWGNVIYKPSQE